MVTVEINVTKKDIGNGVCNDPGNCPIARAILRVTKKNTEVAVASEIEIAHVEEGPSFIAELSKKDDALVDTFICNFDTQKDVKPFSFKLRVPNKAASLFRKSALASA